MKLITINAEGEKHLGRILPFIEREAPDVVCLQEIFEIHLHHFESLGYTTTFVPMVRKMLDGVNTNLGIVICSRLEVKDIRPIYFHDMSGEIHDYDTEHKVLAVNNASLMVTVTCDEKEYRMGTTHFTWTPDGKNPSESQVRDMDTFCTLLKTEKPHIMCGDFNIPRNINPLYPKLTEYYTDTVPLSYASSLDKDIHRCGNDPLKQHMFTSFMVDYIFTQPPYIASDVHLQFGISDHASVIATITYTGL
jgi:endonuclease/exonuclease/phosphatase family metal-dependent hydrolase